MAQYHATAKISHNAVATFAYNCRAKIHDPLNNKNINYSHKEDLLYSNHFMCNNAPAEWSKNPSLCWQSVAEREGKIIKETGKPARHARKIEFALPLELNLEQQKKICDKLAKFYADKGMCVSYGLHKTKSGNVHCHMLLTLREIDKNGKWVAAKNKSQYVYETEKDENGKDKFDKNGEKIFKLDANGNKIKIPILDENGQQKFRQRPGKGKEMLWVREVVNVSGWDNNEFYQKNVRKKIETLCNAGLRLAGSSERVSCLSYKERGIKKMPTIHEGVGAKAKERAEYNRKIKEYNQKMQSWEELQEELFARLQAKKTAPAVSQETKNQDTEGTTISPATAREPNFGAVEVFEKLNGKIESVTIAKDTYMYFKEQPDDDAVKCEDGTRYYLWGKIEDLPQLEKMIKNNIEKEKKEEERRQVAKVKQPKRPSRGDDFER